MADPFVAEIRVFPFTFAPSGWAFCNGQLMPLSQNTALFSLLGTTYGGNGKTDFALPDLQGRAPLQADHGPGLSQRVLGEQGGAATVTLTAAEMPVHSHGAAANADPAELQTPAADRSLARSQNASAYQSNTSGSLVALAPAALGPAGGSQPHNNLQPYLAMNFCIALQGVFPPRS